MDDVIGKLMQFGLSTYEAKAYVALLQKNPAIGYEVSKIAKIPTAKIYETLNSLKNKGIVYSSASEPVLYCPIDPAVLLRRLQTDFDSRINTLGNQLQRIAPVPDTDVIWNLSGYQVVLEKSIEIITRAKSELLVSIWPQEEDVFKEHLLHAFRRGVHVIAGVFGTCDLGEVIAINLDSCGDSSHKRLGKRLTAVIGDTKEALISEIDTERNTSGVWASSPCIILTAKEYIKHDIWGKTLVDEVGRARFEELCRENAVLSYLINNR